jgi:hypothetical protein
MHRLILGVTDSSIEIDHRDGNGLNNTRHNLRIATSQQNAFNRKKRSDGKLSQYKGVSKRSETNRRPWYAFICIDGKQKIIGAFDSELEAARAYDASAALHFGAFARLNFPSGSLA